jgi:GT2 family glycosyltransferase
MVDCSIAIPTLNRAEVIEPLLYSILKQTIPPKQIFVVDDSTNADTENLVKRIAKSFSQKNIEIKYVRGKGQGVTEARNIGISLSTCDIHLSLDDDVVLHKNYIREILKVYSAYPNALGVAGHVINISFPTRSNAINKLFPFYFYEQNRARVLPTGISYPFPLTHVINGEWLNGSNVSYKRKIFEQFQWDEKLKRYSLCDDMDISYRIQKIYPQSLFITPNAKVLHKHSMLARIGSEYLTHMEISYHAYVFFKNMKPTAKNTVFFAYGIFLGRLVTSVFTRNCKSVIFTLKAQYNFVKNFKDIKQGVFASFEPK